MSNAVAPAKRPRKITFGELRSSDVRGSCSVRISSAAIRQGSAPTNGPMMSGSQT